MVRGSVCYGTLVSSQQKLTLANLSKMEFTGRIWGRTELHFKEKNESSVLGKGNNEGSSRDLGRF